MEDPGSKPIVIPGPRAYRDGTREDAQTKRTRSGSFSQELTALHDGRQVGKLVMQFHQNEGYKAPAFDAPGLDVTHFGTRSEKGPTAHVLQVDNTTFDGWNRGVPGVGTALMEAAEHVARGHGAVKMTLEPSPQRFKRIKPQATVPERLKAKFSEDAKRAITETKQIDPTEFYKRRGYDYDRDQLSFRRHEATQEARVADLSASQESEHVRRKTATTPLLTKVL